MNTKFPPAAMNDEDEFSVDAQKYFFNIKVKSFRDEKEDVNMDNVSGENKLISIKSFQSSIRKSEKALVQMTEKGANITLLSKQLKALQIGLAMLEKTWNLRPHEYIKEDLAEARDILAGLLPSIENIYAKSKVGSPQKTLLERRIMSLKLAVQAIEDITD